MRVLDDLEIPDDEVTLIASRSSGPGGQNVNKLSTRVTLLFDVDGSASLAPEQKDALHRRLSGRISKEGILRVVSQRHRTQLANREAAVLRFVELLRTALTEAPERVPSPVPERATERRLQEKRRRGRLKRERADVLGDED